MQVQFFFGIGSRYSYLAATQVPRLAAETGARFVWRALHSAELIQRRGPDPFRRESRRGQYDDAYRTEDALRWARFYQVPYVEPPWPEIDWKRLALAAVAADRLDAGESFATILFSACFANAAPRSAEELIELAGLAGLSSDRFVRTLDAPATADRHRANIEAALAAGAFGVPTFVLESGERFWGQDRLPLLRHALLSRAEQAR